MLQVKFIKSEFDPTAVYNIGNRISNATSHLSLRQQGSQRTLRGGWGNEARQENNNNHNFYNN